MNSTIIDSFKTLVLMAKDDLAKTKNNAINFKIRSYQKTIDYIKKLDHEITDISQLKSVKGFGTKTLEKIDTILKDGTLSQIESYDSNSLDESKIKHMELDKLQLITGIGPKNAEKLYKKKITYDRLNSIDFNKLTDADYKLMEEFTHHQILGIKYLTDLQNRIPYSEIKEIELYLNNIIHSIDKDLNITICGSYRRKKDTSGDVDILLTHKNINTINDLKNISYLTNLITILTTKKFIIDNLTQNGNTKYMGFCKFKSPYARRIDIRLVPNNSYASSLLYFTGSGDFNKNMRTYALENKYTLNEYGIYKLKSDNSKGLKIKTNGEEDIFKVLKLDYVEPENRTPFYKFKT